MILTNEFPVEAPVCRVWLLLNELEKVVPCMPGAAYDGCDGDDHKLSMKVKIGAISSHFKGTARFVEKDEATHTAVVRGVGKDHGGKGSATAMVTAKLEPLSAERTRVIVRTDLSMTGRLAQFGGGVISDIAALLISQFTDNLHRKIIERPNMSEVSAPAAVDTPSLKGNGKVVQANEQAPADLGPVVGSVAVKYALRWIAMPLGFLLLGWLIGKFY